MISSPNYIQINNLNDVEELNNRLFSRNVPSANNLKQTPITALSFRPTPTKYQTLETSMNNNISSISNISSVHLFNINDESYLQNRFFALQKCPQAYYIPDSTSELYNYEVEQNIKPDNVLNRFPDLFREQNFGYFNPNPHSATVGNTIFNNHTRNQMKNIGERF